MKSYDVVLIGSGVSSLTAAILLAEAGRSVCVLEKTFKPGGYLHCFNRFGHRFDTGAHYVGALKTGQPFHALLQSLGVFFEEDYIELDPKGFDHLHFPNFDFKIPTGYENFAEGLCEQFPAERQGIHKFLEESRRATFHFQTYRFNEEVDSSALLKSMETPLAQVVDGHVRDLNLKKILFAYCALHGADPSETSFGMHAVILDSLLLGAFGFRNGGDVVAGRFVERLKNLGGEIHLRSRVQAIHTKGGEVRSVQLEDGSVIECKILISGIHPKSTFQMLDDTSIFTPAFKGRVERLKESSGIFGLYLKTPHNRPAQAYLKNDYFFRESGGTSPVELAAPFDLPLVAFRSAAQRDAKTLGETAAFNLLVGCEYSWFERWAESQIGKRPADYQEAKKLLAEKSLELVERFEPGFQAEIIDSTTSSPLTNQFYNPSPEGSPYGLYHSISNTGARSLGPRTKIPNLLLTGQNTLFPGVMGASVSGLRTAGHLLGIKPLIRRLSELSY